MRYITATEDFIYANLPKSGFPLILNSEMEPVEPFHSYLIWRLLGKGNDLNVKTWEAYGRAIWDFAKFLDENELKWNQNFESPGTGVVVIYRNWQISQLRLDAATINSRLKQVVDFYEWAQDHGMIVDLPFSYRFVTRRGVQSDLAHLTHGQQDVEKADVLVGEWDKDPVFLTADQLAIGREEIRSTSQRLLWDLMARVGLRSVEARTFPLKYVFNPAARRDLNPRSMILIELNPNDMETKFGKSRQVAVPYSLMEDMWSYAQFERNMFVGAEARAELVLTVNGKKFTNSSTGKIFSQLSRKIGFKASPLMLRHSYAIYTLLVLRAHPELKLEPLLYVRDRLGHEDVATTMIYLSQIGRLAGDEAEKLMDEYDAIYGISRSIALESSSS
ncbi:site-specific integrase [Acidovorax sp. LjRoot66]|uniref:tyrosine-type recombinase/integrase n=1 Tax=Acidovorax sp. LjRoot66 TaxID=3342334 RepID=UPI003ECEA52D